MPSLNLGDFNDLEIAQEVSIGFYLNSDDGDLLLPELRFFSTYFTPFN